MRISTVYYRRLLTWRLASVFLGVCCVLGVATAAMAAPSEPQPEAGQRIVTIYDQGEKRVVLTKARDVQTTLSQADINVASHDRVEPALDSKYAKGADSYTINIYRARPVMIVDGMKRERVLSPYSTARDIVDHADVAIREEDTIEITRSTDVLVDGPGSTVVIDRATPLKLILYGKTTTIYTHAETIGELLDEKKLAKNKNDRLSLTRETAIAEGVTLKIWREGIQTETTEEEVAFETEEIQDADQPVGFREVRTPGEAGSRTVTYEVTIRDGQEVARKEIESVVTKQPRSEVVVVGVKPNFDGDFAAALAKLRACEAGGNYANKNNPSYRGAYQFGYGTWGNYGGYHDPADAPPEVQDQAARELYVRRGWQPWPHCGAGLPDTFR